MCDCRSLPSSWWANDDSDYQAENVHGWRRSSQIAYGWAMLWKCPACGQFWEGLVTPSGYKGSTDYVCKYYGAEHDWFVKHEADYNRFVREGRLDKKVEQIAQDYERKGYQVEYSAVYTPWNETIEWRYTLFCQKRGLFGGGKRRVDFRLTSSGDVFVETIELK